MPTTPTYAWPYQSLTDPPDGPSLGEDLALAIEATVAALAVRVAAAEATILSHTASIALIDGRAVFRARQTVVQTLADNTFAGITFSTEEIDTASGHDTGSNTDRYVFPRTSYYLVGGSVAFANNATNQRGCRLNVNGTALNGSATLLAAISGNVTVVPSSLHIVQGTAGQYVKIEGYQNRGGTLDTFSSAEYASSLTVVELRPV